MKNILLNTSIFTFLFIILNTNMMAEEKMDMVLGDAKKGAALHTKHCTACHKNEVYTRKVKIVKSLPALTGRVKACSSQVGANFTREQTQDVTKHLNSKFYKFRP